jgi:hypothetical protein
LEEKLHVACNLRFLVVIELVGKVALKMLVKILTVLCLKQGQILKEKENEKCDFNDNGFGDWPVNGTCERGFHLR